ncbi:hypothetical protein MRS44_018800 [Fusarium solani]|uniref:uncharacterized protein n=1 Tax=Fusarium solani TaxID=169388 RepID=UPI0032C40C2B|nr:hypothetical protein MRS44_018800 [Fusarium solani]
MATSTTNPPAAPDPFDLGIHTPANLNRGARAALLQNSPAIVNGPIGVSPGPGRMAQTPSSPLVALSVLKGSRVRLLTQLFHEAVKIMPTLRHHSMPPPPPLPQPRKELALTTPHHLLDNDQSLSHESPKSLWGQENRDVSQ